MSLVAFRDDIFVSHLLINLFTNTYGPTRDNSSWILIALQNQDLDNAATLSIQALATSYFGRVFQQQAIISRGIGNYGQALRQLRRELQDPEQASSYPTLMSTVCLSLYELVAFTDEDAWLQHFGGISTLVSPLFSELGRVI